MSEYNDKKESGRINVQDFVGSRYLSQEDLDGPMVVTVSHVVPEVVSEEGEEKLVAYLEELKKPLILNKTNLRQLSSIFRSKWADTWQGAITVYVDRDVEMQGRVVGGIRVKPATENGVGRARGEVIRKRSDEADFI